MATTKNMTKAVAFALAIEALNASNLENRDEAVAKIAKEIENLSKKNSKSGAPTKAQIENAELARGIVEFMSAQPNRLFSIAELSKECPAVMGKTPQKIRPLLSALIKENLVERTEEKGKPMFQFVGEIDEEEEG